MRKNLKQRNVKKKVSAIFLAATMIMASFPALNAKVYAVEPPDITQFVTKDDLKQFDTCDTNDNGKNAAKVYFGQNESGSVQAWWIAGSQNGNLTLFAASLLKEKQQFYEGNNPDSKVSYDAGWGCTYPKGAPTVVAATHYGGSLLRTTLKSMERDPFYFSEAEQVLMNETTIYTSDALWDTSTSKMIFNTYYTTDKLYLANGNDGDDYITVGANSADSLNGGLRIDRSYWVKDHIFWLRTPHPYAPGNVLSVCLRSPGLVPGPEGVSLPQTIIPAFELDLTSVLFASAVPAVSLSGGLAAEDVTRDGAFTLRYSADNLGSAQVAYDYSRVELTGVPSDTYLVVQNKNGAWARRVSGTWSVSASDMGIDSFENCKVWLESTNSTERKTYATMATMLEEELYGVSIAGNATLKITSGNAAQTVSAGSAIADITVEAAEGYYLPDDYINGVVLPAGFQAGQDGKTVTISGTPQSDVTITLPDAAEKSNRTDPPDVTGGVEMITGTKNTMEYAPSVDSSAWKSCTDGSTAVSAGTWYVRYKETDTQKASTAREVTVTEPVHMISVDPDSLTFDTRNVGYTDVSAKRVKIQNTGDGELANINVVLTGANVAAFTLDTSGIQTTLAPMAETEVSVKPNKGLDPGVYQAELKILGNSDAKKSIPITFTVEERESPSVHTHNYGIWWESDSESHWHECTCGDKADITAHRFVWITDQEATADEKGSRHEECDVCGYRGETVDIPETGASESKYKILEGENQTYSGSGGLTVRADGDFSKFTGIKVDGDAVDASNYDAKEGSTIVTLKEEYLSTLPDGDHTMTFVYEDGEVSANFTTADGGTSGSPGEPADPGQDNPNAGSGTNSNTTRTAADNGGSPAAGNSTGSAVSRPVIYGSSNPRTADKTDIIPYLLLLIMSGSTIAFWAGRKKKE